MEIQDWFDPKNLDHLRAWKHLNHKGTWPEGFIPKDVECNSVWTILISQKMANLYADEKLKGRTIK